MGGKRRIALLGTGLSALAVSACGSNERQDAKEPSGDFPVAVTRASFPVVQHVSRGTVLRMAIRNAGRKAIPMLAVTISPKGKGTQASSFGEVSQQSGLASSSRPVWILDHGPTNGDTAYSNTWTGGRLKPGQTARMRWALTPIKPGTYSLVYTVAAGLNGKARATSPGGGPVKGSFTVRISNTPRQAIVDDSGRITSGG